MFFADEYQAEVQEMTDAQRTLLNTLGAALTDAAASSQLHSGAAKIAFSASHCWCWSQLRRQWVLKSPCNSCSGIL